MSERLPSNSQISHYRVVSKIGEGGMGEVYLAQDTKLDRKVALKILPTDFADDESRMSRFVREAKSVSALNHPNILTIHEIGEDSSQHYIATEFIAGKTLREVMQSGPMSIVESLETACQIGAALNAAHQAGIIHRDIKPENVMVRADGLVKVLDFGLAKLTGGSSDPESETRVQSETQPGMIIGTVAYMSPQQARGKAVDARTDVWSLGVVIYEMLSGRQPFRGETMTDTLANILHKDPDPLNVEPPDLVRIVGRMLGKMLEARYESINEVVVELKYLQRRIEFEAELDRKSPLNKQTEEKTVLIPSTTTSPNPISGAPIDSGAARADEGFWIALLPFKYRGSNADLEALAEGLSDDIVTGLSRFSYLRVIARTSTLRFSGEASDIRNVGKELGARYVMEGALRLVGSTLRVSVQLVDTSSGAHLWAETYDRSFNSDALFALQDELVPRIVSTVADQYGALVHSISESLRGRRPGEYSAHEAVLRSFGYRERITEEEHAEVRDILEAAIEVAPNHSDCLSALCNQYWHEYAHGYNLRPDPLGRALVAAQRAVAAAPNNHVAHYSLAVVLFFQKDFRAFRPEADRALALNPMDASIVAFIGLMIAYSGDWESGLAVTERAKQLNPNHPGWYYLPSCYDAYRRRDYRAALEIALKVNMPGYFYTHAISAAAYAQLGEQERAYAALRELHKLKPDFGPHAGGLLGKWFAEDLTEHLLEGLRKAGLEIVSEAKISSHTVDSSVEKRTDAGFWVAVLPFKFTGSNADIATLAEGLSEEIITGLSRFSYLRVISRSSTLRYANETDDVRAVGKTLGARYVMEGSLRVAGSSLRVSVQLIDSSSGAHLWAETYDRQFRVEEIFALQDDLVPRIVSTLADANGVLPRSMSEVACSRNPEELSPYEAVLRSFRYFDLVTAEELIAARSCLEIAVEKAPGNADAWAMLALLHHQDYGQGFNLHHDALNLGTMARS